MVKRKRYEPKLQDKVQEWEKKLVRGLKTAKGFERQRLSKRIRETGPTTGSEKAQRLEREVAVLKNLDLHQAARAHLCSSLLKIKGVAESPNLPEFIRPVAKPNLDEEERVALHNVTSALCNRKQVKDVVAEAVKGTCEALRVPLPGRKGKGVKNGGREEQEEQADDIQKKSDARRKVEVNKAGLKAAEEESKGESDQSCGGLDEHNDEEGSEAEETNFTRMEKLLGNSSEDESGSNSDEDAFQDSRVRSIKQTKADDWSGGSDDEVSDDEDALQDSLIRSIKQRKTEDWSGGSDDEVSGDESGEQDLEEESDEQSGEESDSSNSLPPKKTQRKAKAAPIKAGVSNFLPSLMGGYVSGSESEASDVDVAPSLKKNRRGQRARQAIWEKKYGEQAKHKTQPKNSRDQGWDMRKGAVGDENNGPWKNGVKNPFYKSSRPQIEAPKPDLTDSKNVALGANRRDVGAQEPPKLKPKPVQDGPLHPSWEAAKKAKEANQKVEFKGKKITFD